MCYICSHETEIFFQKLRLSKGLWWRALAKKEKNKKTTLHQKAASRGFEGNARVLQTHSASGVHKSDTRSYANKFGVKIYQRGLEFDHLHLVIKFGQLESYKSFVRAVSGILAKKLALRWSYRPYTRVIEWGRHFRRVCGYALQNELEALGLMPYQKRAKTQ